MLGRDGVGIVRHAGRPGADITHLRTAIFRVIVGLELQRVPVVFAAFETRDTRLDPLFHGQMLRFNARFCGYS